MHQAQLCLRGLSGCHPQAPLLQAPLLQEPQGGGQALRTLDGTLGAVWTQGSDSSLYPPPHLRQVTLTPPTAAWAPSCPRGTPGRSAWPRRGGRAQRPRWRCLRCPPRRAARSSAARGGRAGPRVAGRCARREEGHRLRSEGRRERGPRGGPWPGFRLLGPPLPRPGSASSPGAGGRSPRRPRACGESRCPAPVPPGPACPQPGLRGARGRRRGRGLRSQAGRRAPSGPVGERAGRGLSCPARRCPGLGPGTGPGRCVSAVGASSGGDSVPHPAPALAAGLIPGPVRTGGSRWLCLSLPRSL